jgi:hypothetical protein
MRLLPVIIILSIVFTACPIEQEEAPEEHAPIIENSPRCTTHIPGDWELVTAATCTKPAIGKKFCTICGLLLRTGSCGEPLEHDYSYKWQIINEPHSGKAGIEAVYFCKHDPSHRQIDQYNQRTYNSVFVNPPAYQWGKIETVGAVGDRTKTFAVYGAKVQFTATVKGENNPLQTVNWSISGTNLASETSITDGLLTINAADYGKEITVTAESAVDNTKMNSTTVTAVKYLPSDLAGIWCNGKQTFTLSYVMSEASIFYYKLRIDYVPDIFAYYCNTNNYYELLTLSWEYISSTGANSPNFPYGYKVDGRQASTKCAEGCDPIHCSGDCVSCFCHFKLEVCMFSSTFGDRLRFSRNENIDNASDLMRNWWYPPF